MKGRTALVTGGGRGIGRAIVLELARRGARVRFAWLSAEGAAAEVEARARELGGEAIGARVDVRDRGQVREWIQGVVRETGAVGILVNNAGIKRDGLLPLMKDEDFTDVIETNLVAPFRVVREAARPMISGRYGRIVNIVSVSGISGPPGQANYAASKGGLIALTRSLAKEMARFGVTVNAVAPGLIETEMVADLTDEARNELLSRVPMGRAGQPAEVASAVAYLASSEASYVTGQIWAIDGGFTA